MSYDFTSAADLARWATDQTKISTDYTASGIGKTVGGVRQFDCCGLFKCFLWHDYPKNGASWYGKTQPDYNCEQLIAEATIKGPMSTIPEVPGTLVYQKQHMGIYIGGGYVVECTARRWGSVGHKVLISQFKNARGAFYRGTWTYWFQSPHLTYSAAAPVAPAAQDSCPYSFAVSRSHNYITYGDQGERVKWVQWYLVKLGYSIGTGVNGEAYGIDGHCGPQTTLAIKKFQMEHGLEADGKTGPLTRAALIAALQRKG